jgi:tetratricopeptide (TPR) repeat protein
MRRALAMTLCAVLPIPAAGPADARNIYDEAWAWCAGADQASDAHRVEGCTWLIRYGDQKGKDLASAYVNLGQARHDPRDPALALASYEQAIRIDPRGSLGYAGRGVLRGQQGDHAGAAADWSRVIDLEPRAGEAFNARGLVRAGQGDLLSAIADYTAALRWTPRATQVLVNRGQARFETRNLRGALADYSRSIALAPARTDALEGRGLVRLSTGRLLGARADFDRVLRADPTVAAALGNRCIVRFRLRDGRAAEDCDAGIASAVPDAAWPHAARGGLRLMARDLPGADADLGEALRRDPGNAATLHLRALLRGRLGDAAGAAQDKAAARALQPQVEARVAEVFGPDLAR